MRVLNRKAKIRNGMKFNRRMISRTMLEVMVTLEASKKTTKEAIRPSTIIGMNESWTISMNLEIC